MTFVVHGVTSRLKPRLTTDSYLASSDSGGDAVPLRRGPDVCVCVRSVGASFRSAYKNPQHQSRGRGRFFTRGTGAGVVHQCSEASTWQDGTGAKSPYR